MKYRLLASLAFVALLAVAAFYLAAGPSNYGGRPSSDEAFRNLNIN